MRDLNDLGFFAAVVDHQGFSAAARMLGLSKSRLSRRVSALEAQLGVRLVERSSRRFKITEVGQDVYQHARAALTEAAAIEDIVSRLKAEPQGLVRVSCPVGLDRILAAGMADFLARHPRLRLQAIVSNRRVDLIEEGVDIAIRVREQLDAHADLQVKILGRVGRMLVASPAFIATHGAPATPAEVPRFRTLSQMDQPGPDRWTLSDGDGREVSVVHEPVLAASAYPIVRQAAIDGVGIAMLSEWLFGDQIRSGELVRILPDWESRQGILHLVFTSRRGLLPGVRATIDFVAELLSPRSAVWETVARQGG